MTNENLGTEAVNILSPFLMAGGVEISKSIAKDLWKKTVSILNNKDAKTLVENYTSHPESEEFQNKICDILQSALNDNIDLFNDYQNLVKEVRAKTADLHIVQKGDNNIAITGSVTNSSINITK